MPSESHQVTTHFFFSHSYVFSQGVRQKVLIVSLTKYKQTFLKLVAPSTKIPLIVMLHYCSFEKLENQTGLQLSTDI